MVDNFSWDGAGPGEQKKRQRAMQRLLATLNLNIWLIAYFVLGLFSFGQRLEAQLASSGLPNANYYNAFPEFYFADYKNAGRDFTRGAGTAYRLGEQRYLDSVCYWTMVGECHYHLGNFDDALTSYEQALELYIFHNTKAWQSRVEVPEIRARQQVAERTRVNWGQSRRNASVARIPRGMSTLFGRLDAGRVLQEGGLFETPERRSVNVKEIMRCTALALHRRKTIRGATCKYHPFTSQLVNNLSSSNNNGTLFRAWNSVLLGIAQASMEDFTLAKRTLSNAIQFTGADGQMDHNLTPVAMLELALIAFAEGDMNAAAQASLEASYVAAVHSQYDMIEESLSLGTTIHLMQNRSVYAPLKPAIEWANRERARLMNVSLIEKLATCWVEAGDADAAEATLASAKRPMSRTSLSRSVVNSRLRFVAAQISFLRGDETNGVDQLRGALEAFQTGSRWLYQLGLADQLVMSGNTSGRRADQLYSALLRDPSAAEWKIDPFECLAFLTTPHVAPLERWFETKLLNKQYEKAIEVSELVRRHRFFANLPLGGRLLSLRWVMEGPNEGMTKEAMVQRKSLLDRYPQYKELSDSALAIRNELIALPLKPDPKSQELKKQRNLFVQLANVSKAQEKILMSFAVRRQPADMVFPPQITDISKFYERLQPEQAAFLVVQTGNGYHSFLVTVDQHRYLGTTSTKNMESSVAKLLKALGLQDSSGGVDVDTLRDQSWINEANVVAKNVFIETDKTEWARFKELIIVPDGLLWYVPFEVLQTEKEVAVVDNPNAGALDPGGLDNNPADKKKKKPKKKPTRKRKKELKPDEVIALGDQTRIRYSPTLYLAFGAQRPERVLNRTAVMSGRMHPKGEVEQTQQVVKELQKDIPNAVDFEEKLAIPSSLYGAIIDRFVVCSDLKSPSRGGAFSLNPAQLDKGLTGSNLASWLSLPLWGPEHVVLPGFTSAGASGGRSKGNGQDIFLTSCGVLASGTRSLLLSRWRTGGRHSLELTRRYSKNLSDMSPVQALEAGVRETKEMELDLENEPRIKSKKLKSPLKAEHPFFWAGNIIIEVPTDKSVESKPEEAGVEDAQAPVDLPMPNANDKQTVNKDDTTQVDKPVKSGDDEKSEPLAKDSQPEAEKKEEPPSGSGGG